MHKDTKFKTHNINYFGKNGTFSGLNINLLQAFGCQFIGFNAGVDCGHTESYR